MKIKWQGYLGTNHSWAIVAQNISRNLIAAGHEVDLISTNGTQYFPDDLKPFLKDKPEAEYDLQLSYITLKNFVEHLRYGKKNRFGIWNYETTVLPNGFGKGHVYCDRMLPSSEFSKRIFANNGIPESKMTVVPHGIDPSDAAAPPLSLKTKKTVKICANIAQPHIRKNFIGLLRAFGLAFTKKDDVCLVLKIVESVGAQKWEHSFRDIYSQFESEFRDHAEVEIVRGFIPNIYSLYNACDITWTMSFAECFWMPGLEAMACKNIIVSPRYGGQLDFLNDTNSVLIEGKEEMAPPRMQYWTQSPYAKIFRADVDDAVDKIRHAVTNVVELKSQFNAINSQIIPQYTWNAVVDKILALAI